MSNQSLQPSWGSREALAGRLATVREQIAAAAEECDRDPESITLVAVTKFHDLDIIDALYELGVRDFGENRHPESRNKAARLREVAGEQARMHFIGQLQRNKARQVGRYADVIESIDRVELVDALAKLEREDGRAVEVTIQLSLDGDTSRGGVILDEAPDLAKRMLDTDTLALRGVMAVAPIGADTDQAFAAVRETSERIREFAPEATWCSMGMSHDFRSAISQGATHLRIGTAITGMRPTAP